ncbi:methyltransferase domain-containing protein [Paenibacillus sp. NPDC058174]|uniref:methyltransferase domain-containing protein n=1 Tax=Paenibacillus sp. NPDC058174 TaxID=3346366 RepID=UPI0036DBDC85
MSNENVVHSVSRRLTTAEEIFLSQLDPSEYYLNIAISSDRVAAALLERGYRVQNLQLSTNSIGEIDSLNEVSLLEGFSDEQFDSILFMGGLSNVRQPKLLLDELHRLLKPGGFLAISEQMGSEAGSLNGAAKYTEETFLLEVGESQFTLYNFINDKQYGGEGQIGLSLWKKSIIQ